MDRTFLEYNKKHILELIESPQYKPMKLKELAILLQVPKEERDTLEFILDELLQEGKISISPRGKYGKADAFTFVGVLSVNPHGFGFVKVEGREKDIFIASDSMNGAIHQDTVRVTIVSKGEGERRDEGIVVKVLSHGIKQIVGVLKKAKKSGIVFSDNPRIHVGVRIPPDKLKGAVSRHRVLVQIDSYGDRSGELQGHVVEILGHVDDPQTEVLAIVYEKEIPAKFPDGVMNQVENFPEEVCEQEIEGRMDLRTWQTVTIDGEDAKDLDDAVTLTKENGYYQLGVHIADVTHYVKENSALDKEALKRGTSVYLVDRVIPMLPHKLSNGICSLNVGVNRLALSCIMKIDGKGNVIDHQIAETVIRVDRRMTYTSVKKILVDCDEAECREYEAFIPLFRRMEELSGILRKKRHERGAIDFDFPESKILLDERGKAVDVVIHERNVATKIIEDFMLLANETIAETYFWQEIPFVYRVHERPDYEKILKFSVFINNFGLSLRMHNGEIYPKDLQKLLTKLEGTEEEALISSLMLRSLKQARYSPRSEGHFGLAASYYCHFTSPIRRYPDLQIHRIIKEQLHGTLSDERLEHYKNILTDVCAQSSFAERRAEDAEREVDKLKKAEYMEKHLFESYDAVISGVTSRGLYVQLANTVEGLIPIAEIGEDYYEFNQETYTLVGIKTKKRYSLGDKLKVEAVDTNRAQRTIEFRLARMDWEEEWEEVKE